MRMASLGRNGGWVVLKEGAGEAVGGLKAVGEATQKVSGEDERSITTIIIGNNKGKSDGMFQQHRHQQTNFETSIIQPFLTLDLSVVNTETMGANIF
ncbi:hypothetical protein V6N13_021632 [Hibiscus sabdariffa]|uniref:Uncharacterized protein n=1 Tax=Hibiscus sabdariffa TaxID=183260 RepID=A0ABR2BAA5_9ROSI